MRKVLLATTALVAMGGVSAASADISVSGGHELKYSTWGGAATTATDNSNSISSSTSYKISASSVADNGMSMTGYTAQDGSDGAFDDYGFTISDDWGTIGVKGSESGDKFETNTDITDDEGYNGATASLDHYPTDSSVSGSDVSYLSPDMNGFQFSVGIADTGAKADRTAYGAQYKTTAGDASITIKYAADSTGDSATGAGDKSSASSMGLVVASGNLTLTVAQNDTNVSNDAQQYTAGSMAIAYKVSDALTVEAYTGETEDDKDAGFEFKDTGYGLTYTVVSGLTASVTHNSWDHKSNAGVADSGTNTAVALNLSF